MTPPTNLRVTTFGRRPPGMVIPTLLIREPVSSRKMAVGTAAEIRKVVGPRVIVTAIPATSKTVLIARGAHRRVPILGLTDVNLNSVVQHALGGVDELLRPEEEAFLDVRRLIL